MSKLSGAIKGIKSMDELSSLSSPIHDIHPLIKLVITLVYIFIVVSFNKYNLRSLAMMVLFLAGFILDEISFIQSMKKLIFILPIFILLGIFNPIFDHKPLLEIGKFCDNRGNDFWIDAYNKGFVCLTHIISSYSNHRNKKYVMLLENYMSQPY